MNLPPTPPTRCLIALGSNLGDRLDNLRAGVAGIDGADGIEVVAVSPLYETAPVGGPENQGPYLNAALAADTTLEAADVLDLLHRIEADRERERIVHWGPRTLDLDLLVHGDLVSDADTLEVPHPRMHERRFVMVPVCDLAPDLVHPRLGRTMLDLLGDLPAEPGDLTELTGLTGTWHDASHTIPNTIPHTIPPTIPPTISEQTP
jgi:2-amino-4-hydroxy-6-hydroxymethyldihydropteridine diphosphokinase